MSIGFAEFIVTFHSIAFLFPILIYENSLYLMGRLLLGLVCCTHPDFFISPLGLLCWFVMFLFVCLDVMNKYRELQMLLKVGSRSYIRQISFTTPCHHHHYHHSIIFN